MFFFVVTFVNDIYNFPVAILWASSGTIKSKNVLIESRRLYPGVKAPRGLDFTSLAKL